MDPSIYLYEDTIAAVSTPAGRGAIAVIRISGPEAIDIGQKLVHSKRSNPPFKPRTMIYGELVDPDSQDTVDSVLCVVFNAPHSYTGENMAEIHCHGSEAVIRKTLELLNRYDVRFAEPGEFTFRAVRNSKMDLVQAEAVGTLIDSRSQLERSLSLRMMEGAFSRELASLKEMIITMAVEIETQIEFPDDAAEEILGMDLAQKIHTLFEFTNKLKMRAVREQRFQQGIAAVLAGKPNVGKSSLFNALLGRERAIVTPHPGTTRDSIEGTIELNDRPVTLIDTAGLRETHEEIESIGIQRSRDLLTQSHIVIFMYEYGQDLTQEEFDVLQLLRDSDSSSRVIMVANKCDLRKEISQKKMVPHVPSDWPLVNVSAIRDEGINELLHVLETKVMELLPDDADSAYLISARQEALLADMVKKIDHCRDMLNQQAPFEIIAEELRESLKLIAQLDGSGVAPDIIDTIFSRFCIGK